jgi:uncharacterized membrane protein YcaP (DUF421 family)
MGKRQIGEMQPFEFVITLLVAEVAAIPLNDPSIPIHFGVIPMLVLLMMHVFMSVMARHSIIWRRFMSGKSVIAVDQGSINYTNLKRMNMNISDLIEAVRCEGSPDFIQIEYAIFETNGKICIVPKQTCPTEPSPALLPMPVVVDGKWDWEVGARVGISIQQIEGALGKHGIKRLQDMALVDIRQDGMTYFATKKDTSFVAKLSVSRKW